MAGDLPERWVPIPGSDGYEASSCGRIRSVDKLVPHWRGGFARRKGRVLAAPIGGRYRHVNWIVDGKRVNLDVHRLVCLAFHGEPDRDQVVRHLDGDKFNNCASNLAWGTSAENAADRVRHGTAHYLRVTHCPQGHPYSPENTYRAPGSPRGRHCRECMVARDAARAPRRRKAA